MLRRLGLSLRLVMVIWSLLLTVTCTAYYWDSYRINRGANYTEFEGYQADYINYSPDMSRRLIDTVCDFREYQKEPTRIPQGSGKWDEPPGGDFQNGSNYDLEIMNISYHADYVSVEVYLSAPYWYDIKVLSADLVILNSTTGYNDDIWYHATGWDAEPKYLVVAISEAYNVTDDKEILPIDNFWGEGSTEYVPYINRTFSLEDEGASYFVVRAEFTRTSSANLTLYFAYGLVTWALVFFTCELISTYKEERPPTGHGIRAMAWRYKWHFSVFLSVYLLKIIVDTLNDPVRDWHGLDFTDTVHAFEGNTVLHIQNFLLHDGTTLLLAPFYAVGFVLFNLYLLVYFAWKNDWFMSTKVQFNYLLVYLLAVPFFLLTPVFVTSVGIPGMRALAYDFDPQVHNWAFAADVFDNCFPSLHVGVPTTAATIIWLECKRRGKSVVEAGYLQPFIFCVACVGIYSISVLYLGIHWVVDVPAGMALGIGCAHLTDKVGGRLSSVLEGANNTVDRLGGRWLLEKLGLIENKENKK